ncbi:hypothetical protein HRD49_23915 [Corallococcus exiguus]|uniref:hypothetical protein n=1 Tax=Corallococcus exiguus TaxID=83462 RepID=UPI0014722881|nr:hypothetical protein [Corallococcus exiguus]NNC17566.1 hypothetical protein [Corallococcus exiguus]NRD64803.1 hypothetical protein [Corallococcus exiguus]
MFNGLAARCAAAEMELQDDVWTNQWLRWILFSGGTASALTGAALTGINSDQSHDFVRVRNTAIGLGIGGTLLSAITAAALFEKQTNSSSGMLGRVRSALDGGRAEWPFVRTDPVGALRVLRSMASACSEAPLNETVQIDRLEGQIKQAKLVGAAEDAAGRITANINGTLAAMPPPPAAAALAPPGRVFVSDAQLEQLELLVSEIEKDPLGDPGLLASIDGVKSSIASFKATRDSDKARALAAAVDVFRAAAKRQLSKSIVLGP